MCIRDSYRPAGFWWGAMPKKQWSQDPELSKIIMEQWQEPHGDRRQELVFIGQDLPRGVIISALNDCLLTDEEMEKYIEFWNSLVDPFPSWSPDNSSE